MTISEKLSETIAQKERIASEVALQGDKIAEIQSGIYDILESEELPKSEIAQLVDRSITEVIASDLQGATTIGFYAFAYCESLQSIEIPNSVISIDDYVFQDCSSLTSVTIPNSVRSIGNDVFNNCRSLTNITIPASVTSLGDQVFWSCGNLTSVVFEEGCRISKMGDFLFWLCDNLESVNIPNNVTEIGGNTFTGRKITSLIIPASVTTIGASTFRIGSSSNLATLTFLGTTPPSIQSNTFTASYLQNIIVPKGCGDVYKSATNWSNFADYIVEASE